MNFKKLSFLLLAISGFSIAAKSQAEFKVNPVALLFATLNASAEYIINEDWGTEVDMAVGEDFYLAYINGKHYFNPKKGADGFNVGSFAGVAGGDGDSSVGLGFFFGYKAVSRKKVIFELALGVGRGFGDGGVLPYFKVHIGFRTKGSGQ